MGSKTMDLVLLKDILRERQYSVISVFIKRCADTFRTTSAYLLMTWWTLQRRCRMSPDLKEKNNFY